MTDTDLINLLRNMAKLISDAPDGMHVALGDPLIFQVAAERLEKANQELEALRAESAWLTRILNTQL